MLFWAIVAVITVSSASTGKHKEIAVVPDGIVRSMFADQADCEAVKDAVEPTQTHALVCLPYKIVGGAKGESF